MRKALAKKQATFNTSNHVNDVLLPSYNALKDPYLPGYFDNPYFKKHLRETGVLKKKRKYSVKLKKQDNLIQDIFHKEIRPVTKRKTSRKSKSFAKTQHDHGLKLPQIEQEERTGLKSSQTTRPKRVYVSRQKLNQSEEFVE